ncbi:MAG: zinc-ribbon domain-containing protein, partial [Terriglobales bacterium]
MRCPYCGNENPDDHRFCGMCGRPIPEPTAESPLPVKEPVRHRDPEPPPPAPAYTGGIFNLGAPPDRPHHNLDYLLEDDEEPRSNKGIIILGILALALVAGLGYLRWRNVSLPWFKSQTSTSKAAPIPSSPDAASDSAPADQLNRSASTPPAQPAAPAPSPADS